MFLSDTKEISVKKFWLPKLIIGYLFCSFVLRVLLFSMYHFASASDQMFTFMDETLQLLFRWQRERKKILIALRVWLKKRKEKKQQHGHCKCWRNACFLNMPCHGCQFFYHSLWASLLVEKCFTILAVFA